MKSTLQVQMASLALVPLLVLSLLGFIVVSAVLWKKGRTIEALLVWNSLLLYIIAVILLLK